MDGLVKQIVVEKAEKLSNGTQNFILIVIATILTHCVKLKTDNYLSF